jgi:DNA-binding winged helix-turn-helix (wHTH) protein/TolB-like protein
LERVRFGIFDFDPATGELRREGIPVRLQSQPAQVLRLLVEHAGEIVSRDTLRTSVWGTETFVDFDRGLNFCIARIRSALGDSADSPRFVRTVPKRGYQFVAPVVAPKAPAREPVVEPKRFSARSWPVAVAAAAILLCALAVWGWNSWIAKPAIRVAVARFDNETGNPDFDRFADALTDSVAVELTSAATGHYEVIGNAAILRGPRDKRDPLAIASSLRVGYVVLGQVQNDNHGVRVLAHLIALPEQTHVQVVRTDAGQPQSEIAHTVATRFSAPISAARRRPSSSHAPAKP